MIRRLVMVLVAALATGQIAYAQQPPPKQGVDSTRRAADTTKKAPQDTIKKVKADSIALSPPDSVTRALMARKGYGTTRYEGDSVTFATRESDLYLYGKPGKVEMGKTRIAGESILYSDSSGRVVISGNPGRLHDPTMSDDITAFAPITYYLKQRRGTANEIRTSANSGSIWYLSAEGGAYVPLDSGKAAFLGRNVSLTTDSSANPQYHFEIGELKKFNEDMIVGSPAKLYIGEVPILWLPWFWTPAKRGRHSGILTPQFTFAELARSFPTYRRHVDNLGFYLAPSDYYDAQMAADWRSGARPVEGDPGFLRLRGTFRYHWLDRFLAGEIGAERMIRNDGDNSLTLHATHDQKFSQRTSLNLSLNYTTSTSILQQTTINPFLQVANIQSRINYQTHVGAFSTTLGGSRTQYPGRLQVDQDFPTFNVTSKPLSLASWLTWSPSLSTSNQQSFHLDSPSEFAFHRVVGAGGALDSVRNDRGTRSSSLAFATPFKAGRFSITANLRLLDRENDFPEAKLVIDPADTSKHRMIVYARTYLTTLDWDVGMNLPQAFQGTFNLTPSLTLQNVDPGAFIVRSERTGSAFVSQSKRPTVGLSISPTVFHTTRPFGPFLALRHSITPSIAWTYAPKAAVSDEYLGAYGRTRAGYLGALAQDRVSLTLSQSLDAKLRPDSAQLAAGTDRKLNLLTLNFSALDYDFELAKATGRVGIASDRFRIDLKSGLLPGFSFGVDYSLFDAPVISDTAHFSIYPEGISAQLALGHGQGGLGIFGKFFAWATGEKPRAKGDTAKSPVPGQGIAPPPLPGTGGYQAGRSHAALTDLPVNQPWSANIGLSSNHPRPPHGSNVIQVDPRATCDIFRDTNPIQYTVCLQQQPPPNSDFSQTQTTGGGPVYSFPATTALTSNITFSLTPNWSANWSTNYDLERHEFASQIVQLQRDLKDWRASFGFTKGPNGNFAFHFLITLKPAPDLQFPYDQTSYRATAVSQQ